MSYETSLSESLDELDAGRDVVSLSERDPENAQQLREDLGIAVRLRELATGIAVPVRVWERAQFRLETTLRDLRAERIAAAVVREVRREEARPKRGFALPSFRFSRGMLVQSSMLVAGLFVLALIPLLFAGGSGSGPSSLRSIIDPVSSAEAAISGVVVSNTNGILAVQTTQGLANVNVDETASVKDDTGISLAIEDVQPGEIVEIRASRAFDGSLTALQVDQHAAASLRSWCKDHTLSCQQLASVLGTQAGRCGPTDEVCATLRASIAVAGTPGTAGILSDGTVTPTVTGTPGTAPASVAAPVELKQITLTLHDRCDRKRTSECLKLRDFCDHNEKVCDKIDGWIKEGPRLATSRDAYLDGVKDACENREIGCLELSMLCSEIETVCGDIDTAMDAAFRPAAGAPPSLVMPPTTSGAATTTATATATRTPTVTGTPPTATRTPTATGTSSAAPPALGNTSATATRTPTPSTTDMKATLRSLQDRCDTNSRDCTALDDFCTANRTFCRNVANQLMGN